MRPLLTLILCMMATACVSSGSYERLERQNQLLTMERDNLRKDKQLLQREVKGKDDEISRLEQRLSEREGEGEDLKHVVQLMNDEEKRAQSTVTKLRQLTLSYKQWVLAHKLEAKPGANELMKLTDELAPPTPPPAPAPEATQAMDAKVTH